MCTHPTQTRDATFLRSFIERDWFEISARSCTDKLSRNSVLIFRATLAGAELNRFGCVVRVM